MSAPKLMLRIYVESPAHLHTVQKSSTMCNNMQLKVKIRIIKTRIIISFYFKTLGKIESNQNFRFKFRKNFVTVHPLLFIPSQLNCKGNFSLSCLKQGECTGRGEEGVGGGGGGDG